MLAREDYLKIIEEIRNTEKGALDSYIDKKLVPRAAENDFFIETLYKDIHYVLKGIDKEGEGDLVFEDNDFAMEDGDFKLTGYQTRLHDITIWLHMGMSKKILSSGPGWEFVEKMQQFERGVLNNDNYTPEYRAKLDAINRSLKRERFENYKKPNWFTKGSLKLIDVIRRRLKITTPFVEIDLKKKASNYSFFSECRLSLVQ